MESNPNNNISQHNQDPNKLVLSNNGKNFLNRASTWTRFMAIYAFVIGGLNLLNGLRGLSNPFVAKGMSTIMILVGLVLTVLPAIYLYNFSNQARDAARNNDSKKLESSMTSLKNYLMANSIIIISVFGLGLLVFVAAAANPRGFY